MSKSENKVSIIMSVYNDEQFVEKAIKSVLNSSYTNFEFIICNDCSTDNSKKIIESFKDNRIVFFTNKSNCGLAQSLNNCLERATGDYIMRVDSDDINLPNRMQEQVKFLNENPEYSFCGSWVTIINNNDKEIGIQKRKKEIELVDIFKNSSFIHPSIMLRKEALESVGGYTSKKETRRAEDLDLYFKLYQKGYKGANLQTTLYCLREDIKSYKKRKFKYRIDVYKLMNYWRKQFKCPYYYKLYAYKILLVGLIPQKLLCKIRYRKYRKNEKE